MLERLLEKSIAEGITTVVGLLEAIADDTVNAWPEWHEYIRFEAASYRTANVSNLRRKK